VHINVTTAGRFGKAVTKYLRTLRPDIAEIDDVSDIGSLRQAWSACRLNVVVAWRPVLDLCEALDGVSHQTGIPFVPLIVDGVTLCEGPVVVPGKGSCWRCWIKRLKQHANALDQREALWRYYASHPEVGPLGFLDPFALMGAARLCETIEALETSSPIGGRMWQIDMITREMTSSTVVGVHGCARCGLNRPPATRGFDSLRSNLDYLWHVRATKEKDTPNDA
jgi:bacteriocin biosynthesis cyclodehydratase domain-containing protein